MQSKETELATEDEIDSNMKMKTSVIPWRCESNWIVAAPGSLGASITVESSDCSPGTQSDSETSAPVVLKPHPQGPDSGPCEIKICFEQKYEIRQIYVRSNARVYEVYYANSLQGSDEYLCTVRCGVAERDVAEEHGDYVSGELTEETVMDGRNILTTEDDWVKIKAPAVGRSSSSDKININKVENVQDLHEATAQISDADPCSSLTIRLLSLQDKSHVYVDEVYVFVDPIESTGSGNDTVLASSSAQSSLMAMFVPTLLQLSKSRSSQVQEKNAPNELLMDDKMETRLRKNDEIDDVENNKGDQCCVKSKILDEERTNSVELQQPDLPVNTKKHTEPTQENDLPHGHLERALEELICRVSRVEDICLRFEEKMLKPIESMEARLQQVERQLEKLEKNSRDSGLPHCTRICAPEFSCSESNSSSFYNDQSDYLPFGPNLPCDAKSQPSLVVSAPEFSCGEDEEYNDDLKPLKELPCIKPKKTVSIDDALAAALSGFLSTAKVHPASKVDEESQHRDHAESCQNEAPERTDTENGNVNPLQYTQILTGKAPDFPVEEIVDEKHLNCAESSSNMASINEEKGNDNEVVPPSIQSKSLFTSEDSCDFNRSLSIVHLNESSELNTIGSSVDGDTSDDFAPDLAKGSLETGGPQITKETNPIKTISFVNDDEDIEVLGHKSECEYESSRASLLDFEFPILEVKFISDVFSSTKTPLEALLGGSTESNIEAPFHESSGENCSCEQTNVANESSDLFPSNDLLVDFGISYDDGYSKMEDSSHDLGNPSSPELNVSLI